MHWNGRPTALRWPIVVALALGCFGYVLAVFGYVLDPAFEQSPIARVATLPASAGEIGTCLWLLIAGARRHRQHS
jgi:hypothetical protein